MLSFSPPPGFHDVSEYTFTGKHRRVIVRSSQDVGSSHALLQLGQDYAHHLQEYLGAESIKISELQKRDDGTQFITVSALLNKGKHPLLERSAFVLFQNGITTQLSISALPSDSQANGEFETMLKSLRRSEPTKAGARILRFESNEAVPAERYAGAALVTMPDYYRNVTMLRYRNKEGTRHISIRVEEPTGTEAKAPKGLLANAAGAADEMGNSFFYETGQNLWKPRKARTGLADGAQALAAAQPPRASSAADELREIGSVRVKVHVRFTDTDTGASDMAKTVAESVGSG